jgi:lysophospholipase L1-like esterase
MTLLAAFLLMLTLLVVTEALLVVCIRACRRLFPWLITEEDETPRLEEETIRKFMDQSFDPELGWVRRPNTQGTERGANGDVQFHIDERGSRFNTYSHHHATVATFGDSYTFCRQVNDDETWQAVLSRNTKLGVLNYGVGNYGVDQALLRYERNVLPESVRLVVMGFVPETICRIQSRWKHYLEFGNTLAFKPRFVLAGDGKLSSEDNPIKRGSDFQALESLLPAVRRSDTFYHQRFRNLQFRLPYTISFMRNPARHSKVILAVGAKWVANALSIKSERLENLPFSIVMRDNIKFSHKLYGDKVSIELLLSILVRFKNEAESRGHIPLVVLMPQLLDLKLAKGRRLPYAGFFRELGSVVNVIDMSENLLKISFDKLYMNDQYGGHFSAYGNVIVAREIQAWIERSGKLAPASGGMNASYI